MTGTVAAPAGALDALVDAVCRRAAAVRGEVHAVVATEVDAVAPLADPSERAVAISRCVARLTGLDALEEHLADPSVDEVMVNAGREVWIDRDGELRLVDHLPPGVVDVVLERVLAPTGKRLDRATPIVDARLADGARLCAVVAPVAIDGTTVSIRRHRRRTFAIDRFARAGVAELLAEVVDRRLNVLVTGATSSGKTSLLAALLALAHPSDRIVVVEDTSELVVGDRHVVRLEARPATTDGIRPVALADLVRAAMRLRPDRLVVGEFRGPEVLAMVDAMNTGHDGSMATCHANGAADGLRRVETLVMQAAPSWPLAAIRRQVTRSIDVVVHVERDERGARRIAEIGEVRETSDEPSVALLAHDDTVLTAPTRSRR